jgi:hypothetical protein
MCKVLLRTVLVERTVVASSYFTSTPTGHMDSTGLPNANLEAAE